MKVRLTCPSPATALLRTGAGETVTVTVKVKALDAPPPGAGLVTVTETAPAVRRALSGMATWSWVAVTEPATGVSPVTVPKAKVEPAMKPLPLTVKVRPFVPRRAKTGLRLVRTGTGFPVPCVQEPAAVTVVTRTTASCAWTVAV